MVRTQANYKDLQSVYDIDKNVLGKGSFGTVYKGTNKSNPNLQIAIKAIDKKNLTKDEIEDIQTEIKMLQQVDHANIINYLETYEDARNVYLCMELCTGGELIDQCKIKGAFTEEKAASMFLQLFGALNHIHASNLIHRDIKPENIMFDK